MLVWVGGGQGGEPLAEHTLRLPPQGSEAPPLHLPGPGPAVLELLQVPYSYRSPAPNVRMGMCECIRASRVARLTLQPALLALKRAVLLLADGQLTRDLVQLLRQALLL